MAEWGSTSSDVIDCHAHMYSIEQEGRMLGIAEAAGLRRMSLLAIHHPRTSEGLPQALYVKARHEGRFFLFAGLNHAGALSGGAVAAPSLAEQVAEFAALGCDGIKMIEGKPTTRQRLPLPLDGAYYAEFFAAAEAAGLPILLHVADPEEFWDPQRTPAWAKARNWGYGPADVPKEQLYTEVEHVLERHPDLKVIFAHFYFLSADLPRAARFLEAHPAVAIDLAPGIEMLYNISRDPDAGRDFFLRYADRIVFGTDIQSSLTVEEGRLRAGLVLRWLETADTFRVPAGADFLLGPPEDGIIRGLALPDDIRAKIYRDNFARLVGPEPKPLDRMWAIEACQEAAALAAAMSGVRAHETPAADVARRLIEWWEPKE